MYRFFTRSFFYIGSFIACSILAFSTGCASGGYSLTRKYAGWINSQNVILRVVLYLLTAIVFLFTMLIDYVVFNTIDFWQGKISANTYHFKDGDKNYVVKHEFQQGTQLKKSTIRVMDSNNLLLQEVVLNETPSGEIELYVDGKIRSRVKNITSIPVASIFSKDGKLVEEQTLLFTMPLPEALAKR
jgi:hypothetical protein